MAGPQSLELAQDEVRRLHHSHLGTEHALWPAHIIPDETPGRTMLEIFQWDRQGRRKRIVLLRLPLTE